LQSKKICKFNIVLSG